MLHRPLAVLLPLLLSACVGTPTQPSQHRVGVAMAAAPAASSAAPQLVPAPIPEATPPLASAAPVGSVWDNLRAHFAMADCDADPAIMQWARRYTRDPQRFEQQMRAAMPQLAYVEQVAAANDVASEFVFLPWIESQYQPAKRHRNRPTGMWQIVPSTARSMGLHIGAHYDGRLDPVASTQAVMQALHHYHHDLGDWRLADYAYNFGESGVQRMVYRLGAPPDEPAIPHLPVRASTREHLAKLLALACVVREPTRFDVTLPRLAQDQHLEVVDVGKPMSLARAADRAGLSTDVLGKLNAGYLHGMTDADHTRLLLPRANAAQLLAAVAGSSAASPLAADPAGNAPPPLSVEADDDLKADDDRHVASTRASRREYTVAAGDSLWSIARHHGVTVKELERWNDLGGRPLKIGQRLRVSLR